MLLCGNLHIKKHNIDHATRMGWGRKMKCSFVETSPETLAVVTR